MLGAIIHVHLVRKMCKNNLANNSFHELSAYEISFLDSCFSAVKQVSWCYHRLLDAETSLLTAQLTNVNQKKVLLPFSDLDCLESE